MGETAVRTMRLSPSRPGGEGCHLGIGDRHMDPDYLCLSANQGNSCRVVLRDDYGGNIKAIVLSEHWPGNSAIRCRLWHDDGMLHRVRDCQVWLSRAVHALWAEVRTLHCFPGWGCTHSAQNTLGQSGWLSTPGSALNQRWLRLWEGPYRKKWLCFGLTPVGAALHIGTCWSMLLFLGGVSLLN